MSSTRFQGAQRSWVDGLMRDLVIASLFISIMMALANWQAAAASPLSLWICWSVGFVLAFIAIYLFHEWGHYLGARLGGADIPVGAAKSPLLGLFDPDLYDRRKFMWMAMGGEVGYLLPGAMAIALFWNLTPYQGLAVGGTAFIIQALWVDVPILWKIHRGAPIQDTLAAGLAPKVVGLKSLIGWSLMGLAIYLL